MQISFLLIGAGISFVLAFRRAIQSTNLINEIPCLSRGLSDVASLRIRLEQEEKAKPLMISAFGWMTFTAILLITRIILVALSKGA